MRPQRFLLPSILFVLLLSQLAHSGALDDIKSRKKLIVLSYPHAYSAFVKQINPGEYEGVDVRIMKTFANKLGVALEIRPVDNLNQLIPDLLAGKGDVLASGFSITPEREKIVAFSEPYFPAVVMVIVRKDSGIAEISHLKNKKCSVVKGSSKAEKLKSIPGALPFYVEKSTMHYEAVQQGKADFALIDSPSWLAIHDKFPDLKVGFELPGVEYYGYGVPPGSDLLETLNQHLQEMRKSGTLHTLFRRQLGDKAVEMMQLIKDKKH